MTVVNCIGPPRINFRESKQYRWPGSKFCLREEIIFTSLWNRFNSVTIPLQEPAAFHADVLNAARHTDSRDDFYKSLADSREARFRQLEDAIINAGKEWIYKWQSFPSEAAWDVTGNAIRERSLESFVRCVSGLVSGWGKTQDCYGESSTSSEPEDWEFEVARLEEDEKKSERRPVGGSSDPIDARLCNVKGSIGEASHSASSTNKYPTHAPEISPAALVMVSF